LIPLRLPPSGSRPVSSDEQITGVRSLFGSTFEPPIPVSDVIRNQVFRWFCEPVASPPGLCRPVHGPLPPPCRPAVDGGSPTTGAVGLFATAASPSGFSRPVHGPLPLPCRPAVDGGSPTTRAGG